MSWNTFNYRLELSIHKKKSKGKRAKLGYKKSKHKMRYGIKRKPREVKRHIAVASTSSRLWPEEEKALEDIHTGKTKMVDVSGEDFLNEIKSVINEQTSTA